MAEDKKKAEGKKPESKKTEGSKPNAFVRFGQNSIKFLKDCKAEIRKIVWPTPKAVFKNMGVVLVTIIVIGLFIFGLDMLFTNLLGNIMNIAG